MIKDVRNIRKKIYVYKNITLLRVPQKQFKNFYKLLYENMIKIYYVNVNSYKVDIFVSQKDNLNMIKRLSRELIGLELKKDLNMIKITVDNPVEQSKLIDNIYYKIPLTDIVLFNSANLKRVIIICKNTVEKKVLENIRYCKKYNLSATSTNPK